MAVGLTIATDISPVPGIRLATAQAGIKYAGRKDVTLIEIVENATCAAVFTQNRFCAAPVILAKRHVARTAPRYLLINTGNANAGTGEDGLARAEQCCQTLAELSGTEKTAVLPFSTGVIGETLPVEKILAVLPELTQHLQESAWLDAAEAIMTTDTVPKAVSKTFMLAGEEVVITGMAKGAGMIKPNMATMLAFVATNVRIPKDVLQAMLHRVVRKSFNSITIDSDTSTNDACVLLATGKAPVVIDDMHADHARLFLQKLEEVFVFLAQALVRDGEGATKFVTLRVEQGGSIEECREVAYTIAHSPLVKTAFFASDPNWGRILAAIGRAEVPELDVNKVNIYLGEVCIVENGSRSPSYTEAQGQQVMDQQDIIVRVELGRGDHVATIWTSDLSYDYVKINAEYRT